MEPQHLIPASQFCVHYNIDVSFLHTLQEYGLVPVTIVNETLFVDAEHLPEVERILHLHQELDINFEGIDAILQLLKRLDKAEQEVVTLRNRLRLYEGDESEW